MAPPCAARRRQARHQGGRDEAVVVSFHARRIAAADDLCAAWAQLATAQMNGRVTDESGAVLPGVTITATQIDTGATRTVVTDASGAYASAEPAHWPYRLEAMLSGFRTYVQTGIVLQVAGAR